MAVSLTDARSAELYARALQRLPGGVNSPVRAMGAIGRDPLFIERGQGAELVDVDGNRYVDYVCSWGPLIHGHAHPAVIAAVVAAAERGHDVRRADPGRGRAGRGDRPARAVGRDAAHDLLGHRGDDERDPPGPRGDRAREAPEVRRRLPRPRRRPARAGRLGPGHAARSRPAPGVPEAATADDGRSSPGTTPRRSCGPPRSTTSPRSWPSRSPANMGLVAARRGLPRAAARARERQRRPARLRRGHHRLPRRRAAAPRSSRGVMPDLTVMGKVIGGGLPAAAYGGPRELMELLAPAGDVYQAGTLSGNPLAVAAGLTTLQLLDERRLRAPDGHDRDAGRGPARGRRRPARCRSSPRPGLLTVFFSADAGRTTTPAPRPATTPPTPPGAAALLARGVYAPPSQFEAWFPSLAHDGRARRAHGRRRRGGLPGGVLSDARWPRCTTPCGRRAACWPHALGPVPGEDGALGGRRRGRPALAPAARRTSPSSSRPSARATCCTTAPRACSARDRARSRAAGRRPALRARPRAAGRSWATSTRCRSWPTSSRCAPRRTPRSARSWPRPSGRPGWRRSAGGRLGRPAEPPRRRRGRAIRAPRGALRNRGARRSPADRLVGR